MGSKNAPQNESRHPLIAKMLDMEAQLLEMRILVNALLMAVPNRPAFFREVERDIQAWANRKTLAAQSDVAIIARERLLAHIRAFREDLEEASRRQPVLPRE